MPVIEIDEKEHDLQVQKQMKASIKDGSYFKDAYDWYFFQYLSPICDRTLLVFSGTISAIVIFLLAQMIEQSFPLVEEFPIFYKSKDQAVYIPKLGALKTYYATSDQQDKKEIGRVDEYVARYLLATYVKGREEYDYSKASIAAVNDKFKRIKATSAASEYTKFQTLMSRNNPQSPLKYFGKNIDRKVQIESVKFIRKEPEGFASIAKDFMISDIPTQAEVRFRTTLTNRDAIDESKKYFRQRFLAKINFSFKGIGKNQTGPVDFVVNKYDLYRVK